MNCPGCRTRNEHIEKLKVALELTWHEAATPTMPRGDLIPKVWPIVQAALYTDLSLRSAEDKVDEALAQCRAICYQLSDQYHPDARAAVLECARRILELNTPV